jgi:hypothetical protein
VVSLRRPKIIVAADEPVSTTGYGAMWWTFDRMGVDFTPMTIDAIKNAKLDNYNVIILPDLPASVIEPMREALDQWVRAGGTLIAVGGSASALSRAEKGLGDGRRGDVRREDAEMAARGALARLE